MDTKPPPNRFAGGVGVIGRQATADDSFNLFDWPSPLRNPNHKSMCKLRMTESSRQIGERPPPSRVSSVVKDKRVDLFLREVWAIDDTLPIEADFSQRLQGGLLIADNERFTVATPEGFKDARQRQGNARVVNMGSGLPESIPKEVSLQHGQTPYRAGGRFRLRQRSESPR